MKAFYLKVSDTEYRLIGFETKDERMVGFSPWKDYGVVLGDQVYYNPWAFDKVAFLFQGLENKRKFNAVVAEDPSAVRALTWDLFEMDILVLTEEDCKVFSVEDRALIKKCEFEPYTSFEDGVFVEHARMHKAIQRGWAHIFTEFCNSHGIVTSTINFGEDSEILPANLHCDWFAIANSVDDALCVDRMLKEQYDHDIYFVKFEEGWPKEGQTEKPIIGKVGHGKHALITFSGERNFLERHSREVYLSDTTWQVRVRRPAAGKSVGYFYLLRQIML